MHRRPLHPATFAAFALAATAFLAAAAPAHADQWTHTYSVSGGPMITLHATQASVEISQGASGQVYAQVTTTSWSIPRDVKITDSQNGSQIEIDVRSPHNVFNWFGSSSHSLRVILHVPAQAGLDLQTGDGNITVDSISGDLRLDSGDGNISATHLSGNLRFHTGDGHVEASNLDGSLAADTGDGHISVDGRFDALNLRSGDGSIVVGVSTDSHPSSTWNVSTGDGSITLRLPSAFAATLDAHTGDGHISLDFPVAVTGSLSGSSIHGQLNGGGPLVVLRSGNGSIHVEKR